MRSFSTLVKIFIVNIWNGYLMLCMCSIAHRLCITPVVGLYTVYSKQTSVSIETIANIIIIVLPVNI